MDGKPAAGGVVTLIPQPARPNKPYLYKKASVDSNGRFHIAGLAPGDYKLYAWEEGTDVTPYLDPEFFKSFESAGTEVAVVEGGRETVDLRILRPDDALR